MHDAVQQHKLPFYTIEVMENFMGEIEEFIKHNGAILVGELADMFGFDEEMGGMWEYGWRDISCFTKHDRDLDGFYHIETTIPVCIKAQS